MKWVFIILQIITKHYQKLYASESNNLDKWINPLRDTDDQNWLQQKLENLNSLISITKIKFIIKNFPTKKTRNSDEFTGEFALTFMEEELPILYKNLSENITGKNTFPAHLKKKIF